MIANNEPLSNIPRIEFRYPVHHDPDVIAAEFTLHTAANGDTVTGVIYAGTGACSCGDYKAQGHCIHAAAYLADCWSAVHAMAQADRERKAALIEVFAEVA